MTPAQYQKAINAASGAGIILTPVIPDGINATGFKVNSDDKTVASLTESMPLILAGYDVNFGLATLRNVSGMKAGRQPIIAVDPDLNPNR